MIYSFYLSHWTEFSVAAQKIKHVDMSVSFWLFVFLYLNLFTRSSIRGSVSLYLHPLLPYSSLPPKNITNPHSSSQFLHSTSTHHQRAASIPLAMGLWLTSLCQLWSQLAPSWTLASPLLASLLWILSAQSRKSTSTSIFRASGELLYLFCANKRQN